jgi:TonB family protein
MTGSMGTALEQPSTRRLSPAIWIGGALGAVAIHAGCLAVALAPAPADDEVDLGAPAIEIGIELAAPRLEPIDLPVGPEAEATAPSQAVVEQKAIVEQSDLPKAEPTQTDDPDRLVTPNDANKPPEETPKMAAPAAEATTASIASEATAMPSITNAISPRSVSPAPGTGESTSRQRATWQKELAAHLNKYKRYPAERMMQRAEVIVHFALDRRGRVVSMQVARGSGDRAFDEAALAMLQRANPLPAPPPLVADEGLNFTLPVIFHARERR